MSKTRRMIQRGVRVRVRIQATIGEAGGTIQATMGTIAHKAKVVSKTPTHQIFKQITMPLSDP